MRSQDRGRRGCILKVRDATKDMENSTVLPQPSQEWHFLLFLFHWELWSKAAGIPLSLTSNMGETAQSPWIAKGPSHRTLPHGGSSLHLVCSHREGNNIEVLRVSTAPAHIPSPIPVVGPSSVRKQ